MEHRTPKHPYLPIALVAAVAVVLGAGLIYQSYMLTSLKEAHTNTLAELDMVRKEYDSLSVIFAELEQKYAISEENGAELLSRLNEEQERNEDFEEQIEDLSGTVGKLDKLSKIDPELLQKYSKVYFLNEHYTPSKVSPIDTDFVKNGDGMIEYIHGSVARHLEKLLEDAKEDGVDLVVTSAYRSFDEQTQLKGAYSVQYGSGANTFSADQGYSEHQLGTTVDFSSSQVNNGLTTNFDATHAYEWLTKNAHKYGFTLSYPKDNAYYVYEPWHWRFVGRKLARDLHEDGKYFYDLEQREIDTYLISLFD